MSSTPPFNVSRVLREEQPSNASRARRNEEAQLLLANLLFAQSGGAIRVSPDQLLKIHDSFVSFEGAGPITSLRNVSTQDLVKLKESLDNGSVKAVWKGPAVSGSEQTVPFRVPTTIFDENTRNIIQTLTERVRDLEEEVRSSNERLVRVNELEEEVRITRQKLSEAESQLEAIRRALGGG